MAKENNLTANAAAHKCEGIGCAFKQSCGRYLRPEAPNGSQAWASYYASADVDCDAFEAVTLVKG